MIEKDVLKSLFHFQNNKDDYYITAMAVEKARYEVD
jgi:hypothetical protein